MADGPEESGKQSGPRSLRHRRSARGDMQLAQDIGQMPMHCVFAEEELPGDATGMKRQHNDVLYESSPEAVERFERKFEEMLGRASNTGGRFSRALATIFASIVISAIREVREATSLVEVEWTCE